MLVEDEIELVEQLFGKKYGREAVILQPQTLVCPGVYNAKPETFVSDLHGEGIIWYGINVKFVVLYTL
jgi:hypothetical protein